MILNILKNKNGIWRYNNYFKYLIPEKYHITNTEGETVLLESKALANKIGLDKIYLKLENTNPTGSHKDRGLAFQISYHLSQNQTNFVISSSGNSAISAINLISLANKQFTNTIKLTIFISPIIIESKLVRLVIALRNQVSFENLQQNIINSIPTEIENITILPSKRPVSDAFKFSKTNNYVLLRGSTDEVASEGYKTIAFELIDSEIEISDIFLPCSSGTTFIGIYEGFKQCKELGLITDIPKLHIVQSTAINTIAKEFDKDFINTIKSISSAIVDKVAHRKSEVINAINETEGFGWIINDQEILNAQNLLQEINIKCSEEGAMTIAALIKALSKGLKITNPVCIITGT